MFIYLELFNIKAIFIKDVCVALSQVTLNVSACHIYFDGAKAAINPAKGWYAIGKIFS